MTNRTWEDVEAEVRDHLQRLSDANQTFAFHRYPDAKSAGGRLAKQPSDFLACRRGTNGNSHWHIEAKETAQANRLPKTKIRQYGMLRKFWWAGVTPLVFVRRTACSDYVVLEAQHLFCFDECPPSFKLSDLRSFPSATAALNHHLT